MVRVYGFILASLLQEHNVFIPLRTKIKTSDFKATKYITLKLSLAHHNEQM